MKIYPYFGARGLGKLTLLPILLMCLLAFSACSSQKPPQIEVPYDRVSNVMAQASDRYQDAEAIGEVLHKYKILTGDKWNDVVDLRNKISPIMRRLWTAWDSLAETEDAVNDFIETPDYKEALDLIARLEALVK